MNIDGSGVTRLAEGTQVEQHDKAPVWSPDGSRIAFVSFLYEKKRTENEELYVVNADGSGFVRLTDKPGDDNHPAWSPDGQRIAFVADGDGDEEIYVVNADGSGLTRLTDNYDAFDSGPVWSPDGQHIVYVSNRYDYSSVAASDLYIIRADGSAKTNLANSPDMFESSPSWTLPD